MFVVILLFFVSLLFIVSGRLHKYLCPCDLTQLHSPTLSMGRRKSRVKKPQVQKEFQCVLCGADIVVALGKKKATIKCDTCQIQWTTKRSALDEETDIFHKWVDECMEATIKDDE